MDGPLDRGPPNGPAGVKCLEDRTGGRPNGDVWAGPGA